MFQSRSISPIGARQKLAIERSMTSPIEKELLTLSDEIVFERENWVDAFIDYGNCVRLDYGRIRACRGITTRDGTLFWLVRREDKEHGYHAVTSGPMDAVAEAERAWQRRKAVRENWDLVEEVSNALLFGRQNFTVRIEDAFGSPLCPLGIQSFLGRLRLQGVRRVPGRVAALLMKVEKQVGFVIYEAYLRHMREAGVSSTLEKI